MYKLSKNFRKTDNIKVAIENDWKHLKNTKELSGIVPYRKSPL